ncbi:hypothetical protein [Maridesulfovibrio sp.]|uniref:hypothetical protein n=1 Tax=Maridesulfovibrio sp. TaxID=2795000 RepID=UPI002A18C0C2|nr:hypothetical protein [Maridesulfovibrio sp.]
MIIEWSIKKKRGNFRPVLTYTVTLEDFEKDLGMQRIVIQSSIPHPPGSWFAGCLPGERERGGEECGTYRIYTPDYKTGEVDGELVLPWREHAEYPEVEESFIRLREEFEAALNDVYNSKPVETEGRLELSEETRKNIAVGLISQKFLQAAGF